MKTMNQFIHIPMRNFVHNPIRGGRCVALNQNNKPTISDEVSIIISKELNVNGNVCEILEKYFGYTNKHRRTIQNEQESQFKDYRDFTQEERTKHINNKCNKLPIHKK